MRLTRIYGRQCMLQPAGDTYVSRSPRISLHFVVGVIGKFNCYLFSDGNLGDACDERRRFECKK